MSHPIKVALIAGEHSGDRLGAGLIKSIKSINSSINFCGIGGPKMAEQGFNSLLPFEDFCVMGITDVLARFFMFRRYHNILVDFLINEQVDMFIGIDYSEFNLKIANKLKQKGIKTIQYVCPKIWAWRPKRVHWIKQSVDQVLCQLPFEEGYLKQRGMSAKFIGHPLADEIPLKSNALQARSALNLDVSKTVITILPGSRSSEIKYIAPTFFLAIAKLFETNKNLQFVIPYASNKVLLQIKNIASIKVPHITFIYTSDNHLALESADVVLTKMGTSTLETMLFKKPMVTAYHADWFTLWLASKKVKTEFASLPNIIANEELVPELYLENFTVGRVTEALNQLLNKNNEPLLEQFRLIHENLQCDTNTKAAKEILTQLKLK